MSFLWEYLVPFLVLLSVLVFVHEFGHYWAARRCGIRVEVFSVGFGRELWGWTDRAGTRWKIALIPLGGYVRMFGEVDGARALTPDEHAVAFGNKPLGQRAFVVAAGPAANFLFAILLAAVMFMTYGQRQTSPVVTEVVEGSAAASAGIRAGDRFAELDGETIARFEDLQRIVRLSPGRPLEAVVIRDGAETSLTVTPAVEQQTDSLGNVHEFGLLGVRGKATETVRLGPGEALGAGVDYTWTMTVTILAFVGEMIEGRRSTDELGGVLRIGHLAGEVAKCTAFHPSRPRRRPCQPGRPSAASTAGTLPGLRHPDTPRRQARTSALPKDPPRIPRRLPRCGAPRGCAARSSTPLPDSAPAPTPCPVAASAL